MFPHNLSQSLVKKKKKKKIPCNQRQASGFDVAIISAGQVFDYSLLSHRSFMLLQAQSCKSGPAFWVGFGPKVDKNFELNSGLRRAFCLRCTKIQLE